MSKMVLGKFDLSILKGYFYIYDKSVNLQKYKQLKSKRDVKETSEKKDSKIKLHPKLQQPV